MLFTSTIFLSIFLPLLLVAYFLVKDEFKNYVLLIASVLFYAAGEPKYVVLMLMSIGVNYLFGIAIDKYRESKISLIAVSLSVVINLGMLFYFKYMNFFIENINNVFNMNLVAKTIIMPIGISFFTFQAMSYVIDVYRKETKVQKDVFKLALYVSFFPQLIAGPIVKYHDVCDQMDSREHTADNVIYGFNRFIIGFVKKLIVANTVGLVQTISTIKI